MWLIVVLLVVVIGMLWNISAYVTGTYRGLRRTGTLKDET